MPKTLCVVTAAYQPNIEWFSELSDSLAALTLPPGWDMIWALQEDGDTASIPSALKLPPFTSYETLGKHFGPAATRNRALSRIEADLVANIDHDDVAVSGIAEACGTLELRPDIVWVAGAVSDLLPDGKVVAVPLVLHGDQPPGAVPDTWWRNQQLPFHTVGFVCRLRHWRATGGWAAISWPCDDTAAVMAVTTLWPGTVSSSVHAHHRRHPGQLSATASNSPLHMAAWQQINQRVAALRAIYTPE